MTGTSATHDLAAPKRNLIHWIALALAGLYVVTAVVGLVQAAPGGVVNLLIAAVLLLGLPAIVARWALRPRGGKKLFIAAGAFAVLTIVLGVQQIQQNGPSVWGVLSIVFTIAFFVAGFLERRYRSNLRIHRGELVAADTGFPLEFVMHAQPNGSETLCALTNPATGEQRNVNVWGTLEPDMAVVIDAERRVLYSDYL